MVLMKYFFYCFPVRLGVLITTSLVIIENLTVLGVFLFNDEKDIKNNVEKIKEAIKELASFEYFDMFLEFVETDTMNFRWITIGVCGSCLIACALNIAASLIKFRWLSIPYILTRFFEILVILAIHITYMMLMKKYWNLGILILACCIGGFAILFLFYLWGVTIAMFQMIGVVNSKDYKERLLNESAEVKSLSSSRQGLVAVATVGSSLNNQRPPLEMFASDFSGLHRKNYRRI